MLQVNQLCGFNFAMRPNIAFVGSATLATNGTLTLPAGMLPNDLVLLALVLDSGDFTPPSGYTQIVEATGGLPTYNISYKVMPTPPDANVPVPDASGANIECGFVMVFRNVDTSVIFDQTTTTASGSGSTAPNPPSITTQTNNAAVVAFGFLDDNIITGITVPSGYQNGVFVGTGGGAAATAAASGMGSWRLREVAGAEDPAAYATSGSVADDWQAVTIALRRYPF